MREETRSNVLAGSQILVVEPDALQAERLATALGEAGYQVVSVPCVADARDAGGSCLSCDLVVCDVHGPDDAGADLLLAMENLSRATPVVLTSASVFPALRTFVDWCRVDLLVKPFEVPTLVEHVRDQLGKRQLRLLAEAAELLGDPS